MPASELLPVKRFSTNNPPAAWAQAAERIAVLGVGDVGTAVAHALHQQGCAVLLVESAQPTAHRRGMCWVDAVLDGIATVAGLSATRVFYPDEALQAFQQNTWLPLVVDPDLPAWLDELDIGIAVDARLRKHAADRPDLRTLSARSVGIGPGYIAGHNATYAVESAWGDDLGCVIRCGPTRALAGEPRPILGAGRERLIYAPAAGVFLTSRQIGERVRAGDEVGEIQTRQGERLTLQAPLPGVLRGLTRPCVQVQTKTKLVEVDPRNDPALCFGLGERPMRIAQGVVEAVNELRECEQIRHARSSHPNRPTRRCKCAPCRRARLCFAP